MSDDSLSASPGEFWDPSVSILERGESVSILLEHTGISFSTILRSIILEVAIEDIGRPLGGIVSRINEICKALTRLSCLRHD